MKNLNNNKTMTKAEVKENRMLSMVTTCMLATLFAVVVNDANAAGTAVTLPFIDSLKETMKSYLQGAGTLIIDAMALVGGAWTTIKTSTPVPLIMAILSVFVFEICLKIILA